MEKEESILKLKEIFDKHGFETEIIHSGNTLFTQFTLGENIVDKRVFALDIIKKYNDVEVVYIEACKEIVNSKED